MMHKNFLIATLTCLLAFCGNSYAEEPVLDKSLNEAIIKVPSGTGLFSVQLETTLFKPNGPGPFPVVIMNHGKELGNTAFQARARYYVISNEFVQRGYAIIMPMRKGFSQSGGSYVGGGCHIGGNGLAQAEDVQATLDYVRKQSWADQNNILVMGQSHGGLTTLAFGASNPPNVKALINFAGGLRNNDCPWAQSLIDAFESYGATTKIPSLWFYGANDSYFNPEIVRKMYGAYTSAGGDAKLIAYGAFKNDSHVMSSSADGVAIWWPETEALLKRVGLPTAKWAYSFGDDKLPDSHFAHIDDVAAVPYLKQQDRASYTTFLSKSEPRAFALSSSGAWGWSEGGLFPADRALLLCQKNSATPCHLYAINQKVVWPHPLEKK